ncbi:MAG: hypothetical protein HC852_17215 [Acaryochloridaceae cyanobacterium RU_4_10]|nr:hypothetical protein [Acaryochloridaceae cyanobacterium RU_4_10]
MEVFIQVCFNFSPPIVMGLECSELREAERLIGRALSGNPPMDIANELRDLLLEEVYSQRQAIGL